MSDQPVTLTVFAQFYREVILPDIERVVGAMADRLETEYQARKADLGRLDHHRKG